MEEPFRHPRLPAGIVYPKNRILSCAKCSVPTANFVVRILNQGIGEPPPGGVRTPNGDSAIPRSIPVRRGRTRAALRGDRQSPTGDVAAPTLLAPIPTGDRRAPSRGARPPNGDLAFPIGFARPLSLAAHAPSITCAERRPPPRSWTAKPFSPLPRRIWELPNATKVNHGVHRGHGVRQRGCGNHRIRTPAVSRSGTLLYSRARLSVVWSALSRLPSVVCPPSTCHLSPPYLALPPSALRRSGAREGFEHRPPPVAAYRSLLTVHRPSHAPLRSEERGEGGRRPTLPFQPIQRAHGA